MGGFGTAFGGVPTPDPLAQFLGRVLAWGAPGELETYVNIHGFTPKWVKPGDRQFPRKGGGRAYSTLVEYPQLQQFLFMLDQAGDEAFYCISTRSAFKGTDARGNRKATRSKALNRAVRLKAFVLDLDVKPRGYRSQREALAAVIPFFDDLGIKPTIVDTGGGLHAYPTLTVGITPAEWQPLANALIEAARQAGLKFDVAVTRDDDRILRVPGSTNRKDPDNPRPCRLLQLGADVPVEHLRTVLAPFMGATSVSPRVNSGAPRIDPAILPQRPPITGPDADRARAEVERNRVVTSPGEVVAVCEVVNDSLWRHGNGDREPLWKELANLCHYLENGRDFFHDLSDGDPRYDEAATDQKYDERVLMGWPLCSTIAEASDAALAICKSCPLYQKGQSPLHAATRGDPPGEAHGGQVNGVNGHASPGILSAAPFVTAGGPPVRPIWLPEGFEYKNYFILTPDGVPVYRTQILDISPRYDMDDGASKYFLDFKILRGTKDIDDTGIVSVPVGALAMKNKAAEAMMTGGLIPNQQVQDVFVPSLLEQIRDQRLAQTSQRTGWIGDTKTFALGGYIYGPDGKRQAGRADSPYLTAQGTLDDWKAASNFFLGRGLIEMEIIMVCGYTGPLVPLANTPGTFLYVYSGPSGRGKSAAMDCACSVAANPKAVVKTSTTKAATNRVAQYNNIPVHFDELVPDDPKTFREFSAMIKTIVSGAGTTRLNQRAKEVATLTSRNQVVGCGNKSLLEVSRTPDTNAQAARVVEFEIPDRLSEAGITEAQLIPIRHAIETNYGLAMPVFIDFICRNYDQVASMVIDTVAYLERTLQTKLPQRYWVCQLAVIMVAARIVRKLGLQNFDVAAIDKFLLNWFRSHRAQVFDVDVISDDPAVQMQKVYNYYNDNARKRIITDHMPTPGRGQTPVKNGEMLLNVNKFPIRIALTDKKVRMSIADMKSWCAPQGISFDFLRQVLERNGYCKFYRKGKSIGGGCGDRYHTAQEPLLEFDISDPRIDGFNTAEV